MSIESLKPLTFSLALGCGLACALPAGAQQRSGSHETAIIPETPVLTADYVSIAMTLGSWSSHSHDTDAGRSNIQAATDINVSGSFLKNDFPLFHTSNVAAWDIQSGPRVVSRYDVAGKTVKQCDETTECRVKFEDTITFVEGSVPVLTFASLGGKLTGNVKFEDLASVSGANSTQISVGAGGPTSQVGVSGAAWACLGLKEVVAVCMDNQLNFATLSGALGSGTVNLYKRDTEWQYVESAGEGGFSGNFLKGMFGAFGSIAGKEVFRETLYSWEGLQQYFSGGGNGENQTSYKYSVGN